MSTGPASPTAARPSTAPAVVAVWMPLAADADVAAFDSGGHHPLDVVVSPPKLQIQKLALSKLLAASVNAPDCLWVILGFMVFRWELPTMENSILASTTNDLQHERHPIINPEEVKAVAQGLAHVGKAFALATTIVFGGAALAFTINCV